MSHDFLTPGLQAYGLIDSFERAATSVPSLAQALFVAAEVAYDQASSDPGAWATPGVFADFLGDLLSAPALAPLAGAPRALSDVARVRVLSHSGGYAVAAAFATPNVSGVPEAVLEVTLLDSLYGSFDSFDAFVQRAIASGALGTGPAQVRFTSLYTDNGGTEANNRAMAARVAGWLAANGTSALLYDDDSLNPMPPTALAGHPVVFKRSALSHDDTCREYFADTLLWAQY